MLLSRNQSARYGVAQRTTNKKLNEAREKKFHLSWCAFWNSPTANWIHDKPKMDCARSDERALKRNTFFAAFVVISETRALKRLVLEWVRAIWRAGDLPALQKPLSRKPQNDRKKNLAGNTIAGSPTKDWSEMVSSSLCKLNFHKLFLNS